MSSLRDAVQERLDAVHTRITKAARAYGRDPASIALVAVSKAFPADAIEAALTAGQRAFGENYVQEALIKIDAIGRDRAEWHFIGPIQSNKTRLLAERFDWVQSVDRLKVAERLSEQRSNARSALNVLLQVNISGEASKSGVPPDEVGALAEVVSRLPRLRLRGLMAVPRPEHDPSLQRAPLAALRTLYQQLQARGLAFDTLSMGMSDDLESAIAEGSTMVRIGTAVFGPRSGAQA